MRALGFVAAFGLLFVLVSGSAYANGKSRSGARVTYVQRAHKEPIYEERMPLACSAVRFPRNPVCDLEWHTRYRRSWYWF
jgi:hypothetical protein